MTVVERLQSLKLSEGAMVTLTYEEGADVFVHNETEVEDAINETSVINEFASLIAHSKLDARNRWSGNVIEHLRNEDYLEDYQRGTYGFEEYLAETLSENFYDTELIVNTTSSFSGVINTNYTASKNFVNKILLPPPSTVIFFVLLSDKIFLKFFRLLTI